jgi:hypothetical protein
MKYWKYRDKQFSQSSSSLSAAANSGALQGLHLELPAMFEKLTTLRDSSEMDPEEVQWGALCWNCKLFAENHDALTAVNHNLCS